MKLQTKVSSFNAQDYAGFYRDMLLMRRFEEKCSQLYGMGLIGGFCHLYIGQEAIAAGMKFAMNRDKDSTITTYRDHAHMLMCGIDPNVIMAELTGRATGCSKGKGGSMHMFSKKHRFYGGHGIVGAPVAIGTGLAFAHQYKGDGGVCLCYFGDGAVNQGQVYESFNMASMWKLPIVYIIENNLYAMGTSLERSHANTELFKRGEPFNITGKIVDGMNIEDVIDKGVQAIDHARSGKGPIILEMQTYRYRGHSMSDPATYRSKDEVEEVKTSKDPINYVKSKLINDFKFGEEKLKSIEAEIKNIVNESAKFASESPFPEAGELYTDIII